MMCRNRLKIWLMTVLACLVAPMAPASADAISIPITVATDNVEQETDGEHDPGLVRVGSSDLELGMENIFPDRPEDAPQRIGLRFLEVNVPAGATINSAHIQFKVKQGPKSEDAAVTPLTSHHSLANLSPANPAIAGASAHCQRCQSR